MSMTKEEAIERIKEIKDSAWGYHIGGEILGIPYDEFCEIMDTVVSALRPVTRDQAERVWRGEWKYSHTTETDPFAVVRCSKCGHEAFAMALHVKEGNFCPNCGTPMTDKAVDMVMERLEALHDTEN